MKRIYIAIIVICISIFIGGAILIITKDNLSVNKNRGLEVNKFQLSSYQSYIEEFSSNVKVGSIADAEDAINKAEDVWIELYGEKVKKQKPYEVFYDEENATWLVRGTTKSGLLRNVKGGVANILIKNTTGDVIAVWHSK